MQLEGQTRPRAGRMVRAVAEDAVRLRMMSEEVGGRKCRAHKGAPLRYRLRIAKNASFIKSRAGAKTHPCTTHPQNGASLSLMKLFLAGLA